MAEDLTELFRKCDEIAKDYKKEVPLTPEERATMLVGILELTKLIRGGDKNELKKRATANAQDNKP